MKKILKVGKKEITIKSRNPIAKAVTRIKPKVIGSKKKYDRKNKFNYYDFKEHM